MFKGLSFALGDYTSSEKVELSRIINDGEGTVSFIIYKKTTHLICKELEYKRESMKVSNAKKFGLMIVPETFLRNCAKDGYKLFEWDFLYDKPFVEIPEKFVKSSLERGLTEIAGLCNGAGYPNPDLPIVSFLQPGIDYKRITDRISKMITAGISHIKAVENELEAERRKEELRIKMEEEERLRKIKEEQDAILDALENKDLNKLSEDIRLKLLKRQEERRDKKHRDEIEESKRKEQEQLWKLEFRLDREMEEKYQRELEKGKRKEQEHSEKLIKKKLPKKKRNF